MKGKTLIHASAVACVLAGSVITMLGTSVVQAASSSAGKPKFSNAIAFDVSRPVREIAPSVGRLIAPNSDEEFLLDIRPDRGPIQKDRGHSGDGALFPSAARLIAPLAATISAPLSSFEGLSNQNNFNLFGGRVNPPDPVGDVGPNHYVEMINLVFAVYDKQGNLLTGPSKLGDLWANFPVTDCNLNAGDPIVLYDQLADRWILSQFTSAGPEYWNCVAVSQTGDPTGAYYRYAFSAGEYFPDYPKYGVWTDSYILTTREFGPTVEYGIGVYALEKNKMIAGNPNARAVRFFIDGNDPALLPLIGDGLLPPDIDGTRRPIDGIAAPIVGTQDDEAGYGATFDALNIWELTVQWKANPVASLELADQLPVASFDSIFPCGPTRGCLPQPGITNTDQWIDVLSYRQRPTYRLAYRNFGKYEALVTNQSVEAAPGLAGVRWYEIRRTRPLPNAPSAYELQQQGTYTNNGDGVNRWMGSAAMDCQGNIALGYSVVNSTNVYPGIRYTGRLAGEPLGTMGTIGEGTIVNGTGVQRTTNSRWGDYTSLNVDPTDDCTFWYVNEYYTLAGQQSSTAGWQTRIASFRLPGCVAKQ